MKGFVHTDMDGDDEPGHDEVAHVDKMFAKHSIKTIQKQHPLFARGSDEKLDLTVRASPVMKPLTRDRYRKASCVQKERRLLCLKHRYKRSCAPRQTSLNILRSSIAHRLRKFFT